MSTPVFDGAKVINPEDLAIPTVVIDAGTRLKALRGKDRIVAAEESIERRRLLATTVI